MNPTPSPSWQIPLITRARTRVLAWFSALPFSRKLRLFPVLTGATIGVILLVAAGTAAVSQRRLVHLGDSYYPKLEATWAVQQSLRDVQRTLQDAVTTRDTDAIGEADSIARTIRNRLEGWPVREVGTVDPVRIRGDFDTYYAAARDLSSRLILGEGGDAIARDLATLRERHQVLTGTMNTELAANRAAMMEAFARVEAVQQQASIACLGLALLAIATLAGLSRLATTSLTEPLRAAVRVADRVADGDLEVLLPPAGGDEVGHLLRSMSNMVDNLRSSERRLVHEATHDALTELPNRTLFRDRLSGAIDRALQGGDASRVAVLALDLDGFKLVNDTAGHAAGDELLQQVAERLLNATRGCDLVARLGGDEFAVLIANVAGSADVTLVADRIIASIARPFAVQNTTALVSVSVGIARGGTPAPSDASTIAEADRVDGVGAETGETLPATADTLMRDADIALYAAKSRGKAQAAVFEEIMYATALERVSLERALRAGLERGELYLLYQPIIVLETGKLSGVEALVRWNAPGLGQMMPSQFIPLAEETGLIRQLGRWVLEDACRQGAAWDAQGGPPISVTVNVSGRQLQHSGFVNEVRHALAISGFAADRLVLELTESTVIHFPDIARRRLEALKTLGVRLAIDDFGTGYSALSYLRQFPIDVLKIDKSFVDGIESGGQPAALAGAIVALGDALGLRTVAEGVEKASQAALLKRMGCALGQGYHFSRPIDAAQVYDWLQSDIALLGAGHAASLLSRSGEDIMLQDAA